VELGLLSEMALERSETYFHQQVLMYMNAEHRFTPGGMNPRLVKRSYQRKRVAGIESLPEELDYNTSYVEAEFRWMTDALMQAGKFRWLRELERRYSIKGELKQQAVDRNFEALVGGPDVVKRIRELEAKLSESREGPNAGESAEKAQRAAWIEELDKLDPSHFLPRGDAVVYIRMSISS